MIILSCFLVCTHEGDCTGLMHGWITLAFATTMALNVTTFLETEGRFAIHFPLRCLRTQCSGQTGLENK